jgi:hypothetical protein
MDAGAIIAVVACSSTLLGAVLGTTWHLSAKLTSVASRLDRLDGEILRVDRHVEQHRSEISVVSKRLVAVETHLGIEG